MLNRKLPALCATAFALAILCSVSSTTVWAWGNGGYTTDPANNKYGTHDWIAQHALDWLPANEKQLVSDNLAMYLYGTQLPDNSSVPDGVGDATQKHHIYFNADGSLLADPSAVRARQEFDSAKAAYVAGNYSAAAEHLGMVTHYISDMGVFGHVMGAPTVWGTEKHHEDYEEHVSAITKSYQSAYDSYLAFDGTLSEISAYDAAVAVARDTTFDGGGALNCTWMDTHYNWSDPTFTNRCGQSLNLATNAVADALHTFYVQTVATTPEFPASAVLAILMIGVLAAAVLLKKKAVYPAA